MKKHPDKIVKLAHIMGTNPDNIWLSENDFDIEETYCDQSGETHYKVNLHTGQGLYAKQTITVLEKKMKIKEDTDK